MGWYGKGFNDGETSESKEEKAIKKALRKLKDDDRNDSMTSNYYHRDGEDD